MEGHDDLRVVKRLCERHQLIREFEIEAKGGISSLIKSISAEVKAPGRIALGIMVDADNNPGSRWSSITNRLRSEGIDVPQAMEPGGTVIDGPPRVGIWLMPDNQSEGELEDFVAGLVPDSDPVWPLATAYIRDIPPKDRKFKQKKELRAILAAWLATREDPRQMGLAITSQDLDASQPPAPDFVGWLRRTFG